MSAPRTGARSKGSCWSQRVCRKQVKHGYAYRAKNPDNVAHGNIIVHYRQRGISYEDMHRDNKRYLVDRA